MATTSPGNHVQYFPTGWGRLLSARGLEPIRNPRTGKDLLSPLAPEVTAIAESVAFSCPSNQVSTKLKQSPRFSTNTYGLS